MSLKFLIEDCAKLVSQFKEDFAKYIKDKSIPLNTRWDDFCLAVKRGVYHNVDNAGGDYETLDSIPGFSWYDSLYVDRYQTVDLVDLILLLEDDLKSNRIKRLVDKSLPTEQSQIDELKEQILEEGYSHFILDW